jgi:Zn-dependent M16 (insulinase) family peptidase
MTPFEFSPVLTPKAVVYNYMVNFCGQQYHGPAHLSREHAHVNLLLVLLQQDYLHPLLREKGGAYGTGARVRNNGIISLSSYLDPNTLATFEVFDRSVEELLAKDRIDDLTLLEAKIKQFGEVDRVKIPQSEGVSQILKGYAKEDYEAFRDALRTANFTEVVEAGRKYLANTHKSKCVFGKACPEGFQEERLKDFLL